MDTIYVPRAPFELPGKYCVGKVTGCNYPHGPTSCFLRKAATTCREVIISLNVCVQHTARIFAYLGGQSLLMSFVNCVQYFIRLPSNSPFPRFFQEKTICDCLQVAQETYLVWLDRDRMSPAMNCLATSFSCILCPFAFRTILVLTLRSF